MFTHSLTHISSVFPLFKVTRLTYNNSDGPDIILNDHITPYSDWSLQLFNNTQAGGTQMVFTTIGEFSFPFQFYYSQQIHKSSKKKGCLTMSTVI